MSVEKWVRWVGRAGAGEMVAPTHVYEKITNCFAVSIGHGLHASQETFLAGQAIEGQDELDATIGGLSRYDVCDSL